MIDGDRAFTTHSTGRSSAVVATSIVWKHMKDHESPIVIYWYQEHNNVFTTLCVVKLKYSFAFRQYDGMNVCANCRTRQTYNVHLSPTVPYE